MTNFSKNPFVLIHGHIFHSKFSTVHTGKSMKWINYNLNKILTVRNNWKSAWEIFHSSYKILYTYSKGYDNESEWDGRVFKSFNWSISMLLQYIGHKMKYADLRMREKHPMREHKNEREIDIYRETGNKREEKRREERRGEDATFMWCQFWTSGFRVGGGSPSAGNLWTIAVKSQCFQAKSLI